MVSQHRAHTTLSMLVGDQQADKLKKTSVLIDLQFADKEKKDPLIRGGLSS